MLNNSPKPLNIAIKGHYFTNFWSPGRDIGNSKVHRLPKEQPPLLMSTLRGRRKYRKTTLKRAGLLAEGANQGQTDHEIGGVGPECFEV